MLDDLRRLKGVIDPEKKRKIIGAQFIKVFEEQAKQLGTLYSDVIEFTRAGLLRFGDKVATIKTHHNNVEC